MISDRTMANVTVEGMTEATLEPSTVSPELDPSTEQANEEVVKKVESLINDFPFLDTDPYHAIPYIAVLCVALVGK